MSKTNREHRRGDRQTYQLLVKVHLNHGLDSIADMNQLEELLQRGNISRFVVLRRLVRPHALRRSRSIQINTGETKSNKEKRTCETQSSHAAHPKLAEKE